MPKYRECLLQLICFAATNFVGEKTSCQNDYSVALLGAAFTCATLSAQDQPLIHQPRLTPQDSGTTRTA